MFIRPMQIQQHVEQSNQQYTAVISLPGQTAIGFSKATRKSNGKQVITMTQLASSLTGMVDGLLTYENDGDVFLVLPEDESDHLFDLIDLYDEAVRVLDVLHMKFVHVAMPVRIQTILQMKKVIEELADRYNLIAHAHHEYGKFTMFEETV